VLLQWRDNFLVKKKIEIKCNALAARESENKGPRPKILPQKKYQMPK